MAKGGEGGPVGVGADLYCVPGILSDNEDEKGDMGKKRERGREVDDVPLCAISDGGMDSGRKGYLKFGKG